MASITATQFFAFVTAAAAVGSAVKQRKISKEQKKQNKIQNRMAALARRRNIRKLIAQSRISRANAQSVGFQLGVGGSTAVEGATAGITSDTASSVGASNQQFTGQQAISSITDRISSLQSASAGFQAVGALAGQFTGGAGSQGAQNRAAISSLV